jgi:hypothetical protein
MPNNMMSNVSNALYFEGRVGFAFMDFAVDRKGKIEQQQARRVWWTYLENQHFAIPHFVTEIRTLTTLPLTALSKKDSGIYLVYSEKIDDKAGIYLRLSTDYGRTWSTPRTVIEANGKLFVNPVISVNDAGVIGVAWYDNQGATSANCWDVRLAFSTDKGETFSEIRRITPETFCMNINGKEVDGARRWKFGGDYFGLTFDDRGKFHLAWCDTRSGSYQLYYERVGVD